MIDVSIKTTFITVILHFSRQSIVDSFMELNLRLKCSISDRTIETELSFPAVQIIIMIYNGHVRCLRTMLLYLTRARDELSGWF